MAYKHSMTINKVWSNTGASGFSFANVVSKLRSAVKLEIPVGYQDESGFHAGVKAGGKAIKWPTTW
jgi:hypothetical protein